MNSLLMDAILPDESTIVEAVGHDGWFFKVLLLGYIFIASLTVLNLLIGVLCEVVGVVSTVEKEALLINYVKGVILEMLDSTGLDANGDRLISKDEFEVLLTSPEATRALADIDVDVVG